MSKGASSCRRCRPARTRWSAGTKAKRGSRARGRAAGRVGRSGTGRAVMRVLGSITNRIFLASALLAMLSIGAAVFFISARMTRETEAELQRDLTEAATLVDEQRRTQFDNVARTARLIADLPKFKAGGRHRRSADDETDRRRLSAAGRGRPADRDQPARRDAGARRRPRRDHRTHPGPESRHGRRGVAGLLAARPRRARSRQRPASSSASRVRTSSVCSASATCSTTCGRRSSRR